MARRDDLPHVHITPAARDAYIAAMKAALLPLLARLKKAGVQPAQIPEERGEAQEDGTLLVYVEFPAGCGEFTFTIPAGHWAWANRN